MKDKIYKCEYCGKEHDGTYGTGRFCSEKCRYAYPTKYISKTKIARCSKCGKEIIIRKNAQSDKCLCDSCKEKMKIKKCPICGNLYQSKLGCQNEFCKKHNIQHFKSLIKYFGFDKTKLGTNEVEKEFNRIRNILYDLYWNKNMSSTQIANMFNYKSIPTNITQKFFKQYLDIPVKNCKYAVTENYLEGRETITEFHNQYKCGWHITWNNKKVYLRSSYELDYAKELDIKHINYDVENLRIKYFNTQLNEYRCAIPDFYIPSENMIVEIKSEYTLNKQNMIDKKKAYLEQGYNFKLICEHKEIKI